MLTWLNLIEFSKVTDDKQARKADALLDLILPHVSFLNPNFFSVIKEEDNLQRGGQPVAPHADLVTLKYFAKHNLMKANTLELLQSKIFFASRKRPAWLIVLKSLRDLIISQIEALRSEYAKNREFCRAVKRVPKAQAYSAWHTIYSEGIDRELTLGTKIYRSTDITRLTFAMLSSLLPTVILRYWMVIGLPRSNGLGKELWREAYHFRLPTSSPKGQMELRSFLKNFGQVTRVLINET